MRDRLRLTPTEWLREGAREIVSWIVAAIVLIPSIVVRLVDRWTLRRIERRGGLD